jgi:predicted Fe-S protein YdhL (DUF1289 family)
MRNRKERFGWLTMTTQEKLHVIRLCRMRYQRKNGRKNNKPIGFSDVEHDPQEDLFRT